MQKRCALVFLAAVFGCAHAQSLQPRDVDGDGSVDAFYDVQQDLTWLADANHAATSGYWLSLGYADPSLEPGRMTQPDAATWAGQLDIHGVTDWRLPLLLQPPTVDPAIGTPCSAVPGWLCTLGDNELTVLFSQLGGAGSPFVNVQDFEYWTGSTFGLGDAWVAYADRLTRASGTTDELGVPAFAWAVRDGDIALAVPEPSSYLLMVFGLAAIGCAARRRQTARIRITQRP